LPPGQFIAIVAQTRIATSDLMKAQKLFAILTLGLIVAAGVIAMPVTTAISRTAIAFGIVLGIAFVPGAIVFVIRTRQVDVENQRYRVWLTQIGQMSAIAVTLMDDLRTDLGTLLVPHGYEISLSFIDRIRNFGPGMLEERVRVRHARG
jgi:hypothetical protein